MPQENEVTISRELYTQIRNKIESHKTEKSKLKKQYEKELNEHKQQISNLETELSAKIEENDQLSYNNQKLENRVAQLMFELEEKQKQYEQSSFLKGWFGSGSLSNPSASSSEQFSTENNDHLREQLEITQEELMSKISENEKLHVKIYEMENRHKEELEGLQGKLDTVTTNLENRNREMNELKQEIEEKKIQARKDEEKRQLSLDRMRTELKSKEEIERNIMENSRRLKEELETTKQYIKDKVLFDDAKHYQYNQLNLFSFDYVQHEQMKKHAEQVFGATTDFMQTSNEMREFVSDWMQRVAEQEEYHSSQYMPQLLTRINELEETQNKSSNRVIEVIENISDNLNQQMEYYKILPSQVKRIRIINFTSLSVSTASFLSIFKSLLTIITVTLEENNRDRLSYPDNLNNSSPSLYNFENFTVPKTPLSTSFSRLHHVITIFSKQLNFKSKPNSSTPSSPAKEWTGNRNEETTENTKKNISNSRQQYFSRTLKCVTAVQNALQTWSKQVEDRMAKAGFVTKGDNSTGKILSYLRKLINILRNIVDLLKTAIQMPHLRGEQLRHIDGISQQDPVVRNNTQNLYHNLNGNLEIESRAKDFMQQCNAALTDAKNKSRYKTVSSGQMPKMNEKLSKLESNLNSIIQNIYEKRQKASVDIPSHSDVIYAVVKFLCKQIKEKTNATEEIEYNNNGIATEDSDDEEMKIFEESLNTNEKTSSNQSTANILENYDNHDNSCLFSEMYGRQQREYESIPKETNKWRSNEEKDDMDCVILANSENENVEFSQKHNLLSMFSQETIDREEKMKIEYERKIDKLMELLRSCDEKCVEYRIDWQNALFDLEKHVARETELQEELSQVKDMLQNTQNELKVTKRAYEEQVAVLSRSLTSSTE